MTLRRLQVLLLAILALCAGRASAQPDPSHKASDLQARAFAAIEKGKYEDAERLLREQLEIDDSDFVTYYNLACVKGLMKDGPASAKLLVEAIEHGFIDLYQLKRDPQLSLARQQPGIENLLSFWPEVLNRHLEANLKLIRLRFPDKPKSYEEARDEKMRLVFRSAMDATSTEQARADLTRLFAWGLKEVFPEQADPELAKHDAWCIVILPTPRHFTSWAISSFGQGAVSGTSGIGGSYSHDHKRLVAQDLGATLRHEFFHVLHWRSTVRLGQDHPIWIQEGLCSLVEDYELEGDTLKPVPSWRTNISKRLVSSGKILPIQKLATIPRDRFTANSPLANYGQARTVFLYLWHKGKLKDWYKAYTDGYRHDPTGVKAIEEVFSKPIADVDKDYRTWIKGLPMVAEQIKPGKAGLGCEVDPGTGDGPVIAEIDRGGAARKAGLRRGDVITAIDGKPTRDLNELVRLLGERELGEEVEVSYRRGSIHGTAKVVLVRR
jgi:hypothetical protein